MEWAEPLAYGPLELRPWEFGRLQPADFIALLEGYTWRSTQQENLLAYFVCHLLNVEGKSLTAPIGVAELLGPLRGETEQAQKRDDDEEYLRNEFKDILGEVGA